MKAASRSPEPSHWRTLANLGEQLSSAPSLAVQRDRIIAMTRRLLAGDIAVWLDESLFRLPDWEAAPLFPPEPEQEEMYAAFHAGKPVMRSHASDGVVNEVRAAFPLEDQGVILGVLQVSRAGNGGFSQEELDLLEGLASIVSIGLFASHRAAVERFRLNQLNLVREVSAQISNVMDLDELARRVTGLIQETFNYYYVAIFTLEPHAQTLRFRSSAAAPRKGRRKATVALEVEAGQGLIGQAALGGKRVVVDDVRADARFRFIPSLPGTRSEVVLPLKLEERVLGVLDVQSDQLQAFHPNDLLVLDALAANIARAVEGAQLYSDLRRRADQLAMVAEVSNEVASTLDLGEVLRRIVSLIHNKFGYPFVHMFTVHPNRQQIIYEAGSGARSRKLEGYVIGLNDAQGIIPWVARNGESVLANDVSKDARYAPALFPPKNTRSELCVPLLFDQRVIGVLDVQSDRLNAFSEDERLIFEAVAGNIASAIHNADLYYSEQWRRQVADSLREVAVLLSANVGVEQVLDAVLTQLDSTLPVDISAIWLLEEGDLYLASVHGCQAEALERARLDSPDAAVAMMSALISEGPLIRRPDSPVGPSGLAAGFGKDYSSIAAPLRIGDQPFGVLTLAHREPGRYGHEAQSMATTFASYAAVAIENARLYDAAQEQAYASAALLQVAQAVVSLNDLDEILGAITRITPILVGVERIALYLWDGENTLFYPYEEYGLPEEDEVEFWEEKYPSGVSPLLDAARARARLLTLPVGAQESLQDWLQAEALDE
ncbi:MAG: GAF domain-containing protein, partial [Chloroflexota bacterium]